MFGSVPRTTAIKHKVMIMKCDQYDPGKMATIVSKGMEAGHHGLTLAMA
jgi:hypothetical protein